ncbi:polymorphic toxin type 22 domain-containing protein [Paraburkholderia sp.]|uniref:polymorphic toxin type 22 domain-containing protein n=1 Tax=Paraburkholderia sp. TaxID=1926495 RepID=UPI0039C9CC78
MLRRARGRAETTAIQYRPGVSGTIGYIFGAHDAKSTSDFLIGDANQAFISVPTPFGRNVVAAITHSYGGATAIEVGIGQFGPITYGVVPWGHTTQITGQSK